MTPFAVFGLAVLAVLATVIFALSCQPRRRRPGFDGVDRLANRDDEIDPAQDKMRARFNATGLPARYRDGGLAHSIGSGKPPTRKAFGNRKPSIFLTPRQLERVNIQRKLRGRQPLNRRGFTNAVANAWQPGKQPDNTADWLTYLILYECLLDAHATGRVYVDTGLTITPEAPYNGHGGEFAGAGASGDWRSPDASTAAAASAIMADGPIHDDRPMQDPLSDPNSYKGAEGSQIDDAGGPATAPSDPAYSSAPDPSPSYSPDPSPSFDSGSSSSFDAGSN